MKACFNYSIIYLVLLLEHSHTAGEGHLSTPQSTTILHIQSLVSDGKTDKVADACKKMPTNTRGRIFHNGPWQIPYADHHNPDTYRSQS